jgi:hypothetical protein
MDEFAPFHPAPPRSLPSHAKCKITDAVRWHHGLDDPSCRWPRDTLRTAPCTPTGVRAVNPPRCTLLRVYAIKSAPHTSTAQNQCYQFWLDLPHLFEAVPPFVDGCGVRGPPLRQPADTMMPHRLGRECIDGGLDSSPNDPNRKTPGDCIASVTG